MGNIKRRTPNTWIHELTPQTLVWRLDYLWVHLARTNPSRTRDLSHKPESQFARRCFARERTTQQSVNILNRDTYIWVGFQSQCLFSLIPFFSLKERQIHFRRIQFRPSQPSENQGENCLRSEDDLIPRQLDWAQLRRDWLAIKRAPFWILSLLECDAHLHKFIIELVFLNVFSKTCCEGLYHWWQRELC